MLRIKISCSLYVSDTILEIDRWVSVKNISIYQARPIIFSCLFNGCGHCIQMIYSFQMYMNNTTLNMSPNVYEQYNIEYEESEIGIMSQHPTSDMNRISNILLLQRLPKGQVYNLDITHKTQLDITHKIISITGGPYHRVPYMRIVDLI